MDKVKKGGFMMLLKVSYRNIFRNKRRSILSIIAIGISVLFIVLLQGFITGMMDNMAHVIKTYEAGDIQVYSSDYEVMKDYNILQYPIETEKNIDEYISSIEKLGDVKKVFPRIKVFVTMKDNNVKNALLWGIDLKEEQKYNIFNQKTGDKNNSLIDGRLPLDDSNECIIGSKLAKKMKLKTGDDITFKLISSQFSEKFLSPKIVGIFDFDYGTIDKNVIIIPYKKIQKVGALTGKAQFLYIFVKNENKIEKVKKEVTALFKDANVKVKSWKQNPFYMMIGMMGIVMNVIYILFLVVASFLIINTILMVIHERIKEIGMMGALGMQRSEIVRVFFFEALFLSFFGSLFGSIIGAILLSILQIFPIDMNTFTGGIDYPSGSTIYFKISVGIVGLGFIFGLGISAVCTIFPSLKSAFIEPVEALRR